MEAFSDKTEDLSYNMFHKLDDYIIIDNRKNFGRNSDTIIGIRMHVEYN